MNSLGDQRSIIITVFAYAVILLIAIPIHECAHCFAAYLLGDDTGLYSGRITLNPIRHWDLWGTIGMLTVGLGWGKPAPVKPVRARKVSARTFMALTAAAGPLSNVILSYVSLAVFNLLPIPPLDGSRIMLVFLKERTYFKLMQYEQYIMIAVLAICWTGVLDAPLNFLDNAVMSFLDFTTSYVPLVPLGV